VTTKVQPSKIYSYFNLPGSKSLLVAICEKKLIKLPSGSRNSIDRVPVGGEFQIRPVSRSFYLDPILPLQKYKRDQLGGAEVTTP
jgi:hypothetical protein